MQLRLGCDHSNHWRGTFIQYPRPSLMGDERDTILCPEELLFRWHTERGPELFQIAMGDFIPNVRPGATKRLLFRWGHAPIESSAGGKCECWHGCLQSREVIVLTSMDTVSGTLLICFAYSNQFILLRAKVYVCLTECQCFTHGVYKPMRLDSAVWLGVGLGTNIILLGRYILLSTFIAHWTSFSTFSWFSW